MERSNGCGIFTALNNVMSEIGAIAKTSKNQQQGFMYRGIDAVMNALQPAFIKHKVISVPDVLEQTREERVTNKGGTLIYSILKVKYTFYAEDGSNVSAIVIGEGMDSGDKASNKAMSVAYKYACFQVLCIPTEEFKDPDGETPPDSTKKTGQAEQPKNGQTGQAELPTLEQRSALQKIKRTLADVAKWANVKEEAVTAQHVADYIKKVIEYQKQKAEDEARTIFGSDGADYE